MNNEIQVCLRELADRGKTPGIQYSCAGADGIIHSYCAGWADLRARRPMARDTFLMAYSMSKVLTAEAIASLARDGLLSLDDAIGKILPWQPYGDDVTIRHLLEHRSGVPNPIPLRWVHLAKVHADFNERAALASVLRKYSRLKFKPGMKVLYSNIGYWLLGSIVEEVSRQPFPVFVEHQILNPAGITPEQIAYRLPSDGFHASGYLEKYSWLNFLRPLLTAKEMASEYEGNWLRICDHYVNGPAFGGAVGTALGFCRFAQHLLERGDYHVGWSDGGGFIQKEGGGAGFRCMVRLDPRRKRVSALMSNATGLNVSVCLDHLDRIERGSD